MTGGSSGIVDLDALAEALRTMRADAGSPAYAVLARRIRDLRLARGHPPAEAAVGTVTVYDCFRSGRRRVDLDLVLDLVRALGVVESDVASWRRAVVAAQASRGRIAATVLPRVRPVLAGGPRLIGRAREAAELAAHLDGPGGLVVVDGLAGVGKSALTRSVLTRSRLAGVADRPVLEVDLRGHAAHGQPATAAEIAAATLDALSAPGAGDSRGVIAAFHDACAERSVVLLLDDAADDAQIEGLAPAGEERYHLVLTSRRALGGVTARARIEVAPLDLADAVTLLQGSVAGAGPGPGRSLGGDDEWAALAATAGGLPIALQLLASRLDRRPGWSLADHLDALGRRPLTDSADLRGVLEASYAALDADARRTWRLLCLHPTPEIAWAPIAALVGADDDVDLATLAHHHLLDPIDTGRYRVHDLVWRFGLARAEEEERPAELEAARQRLLRHYLTAATRAVVAVHPMARGILPWLEADPEPMAVADATAWLGAEGDQALAVLDAMPPDLDTMHLAEVLVWHLVVRGAGEAMLAASLTARDIAVRVGTLADRARTERLLGNSYVKLMRLAEAELAYRSAIDLAETAGDRDAAIAARGGLATVYSTLGEQAPAAELMEEVRDYFRQTGDAARESIATTNLVVILTRVGDVARAAALSVEEAERAREADMPARELMALGNGVEPLVAVGRLDLAADFAAREAELADTLDDETMRGLALLHRGLVLAARGDPEAAVRAGTEALATAERLGDRQQVVQALVRIGEWHLDLGRVERARAALDDALAGAAEIGDATEERRARRLLAEVERVERIGQGPSVSAG